MAVELRWEGHKQNPPKRERIIGGERRNQERRQSKLSNERRKTTRNNDDLKMRLCNPTEREREREGGSHRDKSRKGEKEYECSKSRYRGRKETDKRGRDKRQKVRWMRLLHRHSSMSFADFLHSKMAIFVITRDGRTGGWRDGPTDRHDLL